MVLRIQNRHKIEARNFIHVEAEKRLHEVVEAAQQMSTNATFVHKTPILYFARTESNTRCPCREKVVVSDNLPLAEPGTSGNRIDIDVSTPLFGSYQSEKEVAGQMMDDQLIDFDTPANQVLVPSLFGNATECPICFRTGTVPGYELIGHQRKVLCFCKDSDGYYLDQSLAVPCHKVDDREHGYVEFDLGIPLVFSTVKLGVYNRKDNVTTKARLSSEGQPLTLALLEALKGKMIRLRVQQVDFTHVVLQFKISDRGLYADFPQDQKPQDYNMFDTTQPVQIVMDKSVPDVNTSDLLVKLPFNTLWKVSDYEQLRMNDRTVIGWSLNARIVQRDEIFHEILDIANLD